MSVRNARLRPNRLKLSKSSIFLPLVLLQLLQGQSKTSTDALISELKTTLMAPCCWSGTVADHGNPDMEKKIKELAAEGKSKEEIVDHFVGIYGERILAVPVARGFNLMVWVAPFIVLGLGTLVLVNYLKVKSKPEASPTVQSDKVPYDELIEKELREME